MKNLYINYYKTKNKTNTRIIRLNWWSYTPRRYRGIVPRPFRKVEPNHTSSTRGRMAVIAKLEAVHSGKGSEVAIFVQLVVEVHLSVNVVFSLGLRVNRQQNRLTTDLKHREATFGRTQNGSIRSSHRRRVASSHRTSHRVGRSDLALDVASSISRGLWIKV